MTAKQSIKKVCMCVCITSGGEREAVVGMLIQPQGRRNWRS